jgi:tetratricopeptide (TPR) repeat protein
LDRNLLKAHFRLAAVCVVLAAGAAAKSRADAEVERYAKQAETKYREGDYRASAELLLRAYELKPIPKLLYNAARAYDKAGDLNEAMRFYRRYLDASNTDADLVRKSARALDRLRASIPPPPAPAPAPPPVVQPPAPATPVAPPAAPAAVAQTATPASPPIKPIVYVGGGLAVVSLGVGTAFAVTATHQTSVFKANFDPNVKPSLRDTAQRNALIADIGLGIGIVLAAGTVTLFLLGRRAPVVVDANGGAGVSWDF